jgi:LmbE family N-acetylglucosaminyl deacetylase
MELDPINLESYRRVLIAAPHPDDETLGNGGLIQRALSSGAQVKVMIATNGDGYSKAVMKDFKRLLPRSADYIRLGNTRQVEILNGLELLGIARQDVIFLSYPDFGLLQLWMNHWEPSTPYRSIYTHSTRSPYKYTFNPEASFCGRDMLADVTRLIDAYRPDLILQTHSYDTHPDHRAMHYFTNLGIAAVQTSDPGYIPEVSSYLIHRGNFPDPIGYFPEEGLFPPEDLTHLGLSWKKVELNPDEIKRKHDSLRRYRSQMHVLAWLLESFLRKNELFSSVRRSSVPEMVAGDISNPRTWQAPDGSFIPPVDLSPKKDFVFDKDLPGTDILAVYAARQADGSLAVAAELRGRPMKRFNYILGVRALDGNGAIRFIQASNKESSIPGNIPELNERYASFVFPAEQVGTPVVLSLGAGVEGPKELAFDNSNWPLLTFH